MSQALVRKRFDDIRNMFAVDRFVSGIKAVAPKHMTAERIVRLALAEVRRNPKLIECTSDSLMAAVLDASQLGLEPSSVLGTAYLVPYRNKRGEYEAKLIPGYQGLIELARRAGSVLSFEARVVNEGDSFEYQYGTDSWIKHIPKGGGMMLDAETGQYRQKRLLFVYAVAHIRDGRPQFEVMEKPDVDAIRARSRASDGGPWVTDYAEMARKTVVRRLSKYLPKSPELAEALEIEDRAEGLVDFGDFIDVEAEPPNGSSPQNGATQGPADIQPGGTTTEPPKSRTEQVKEQLKQSRTPKADRSKNPPPAVHATLEQVTELTTLAYERGMTDDLQKMFAHTDPDKITVKQYEDTRAHLLARPIVEKSETDGEPLMDQDVEDDPGLNDEEV